MRKTTIWLPILALIFGLALHASAQDTTPEDSDTTDTTAKAAPGEGAGSAKSPGGMWTGATHFVPNDKHLPILLWPGLPPNAAANASSQTSQVGKGGRVRAISIPQLIPYFPVTKTTHGTAIIYCPGGGYGYVAMGPASDPPPDEFSQLGITRFVLMYRQKGTKGAGDLAFEDGQRAVRLVRSRAAEWGIDPNRIGLAGTSAGANLTLHMMADFAQPAVHPPASDAVDDVSARPDFAVLISCWAGHSQTSPYKIVKDSPPAFIGHAKNDNLAKIGVSIDVSQQMTAFGIPVLYKEYPKGGHGLRGIPWHDDFLPWLRAQGKLDPAPPGMPTTTTAATPAPTAPAAGNTSTKPKN